MKTKPKTHFYRKKYFLWIAGCSVGLLLIVLLAFRISPWPGSLIIRTVFDKNDVKVLQALEKHTTNVPIATLANQSYQAGDPDALLDVYYPKRIDNTPTRLPVIVWTHGGAWVSGNKANVAPYFKLLAAEGFTVVVPGYSLAPEHRYPTPIHQLNNAYTYIQNNAARFHVDTNKFILAGDSAGAQLTSQMAALITDPSYASEVNITPNLNPDQLQGLVLYCGIYKMHELTVPDPTLPKIVGWGTDVSVWAYANTRDFSDPIIKQMSPYYHVTPHFPTTYISGGNGDPLTNAQSKPFADKLATQGVNVTRLFYPDNHQPSLPHEYQFNLDNTDGIKALQHMVTFIKNNTD